MYIHITSNSIYICRNWSFVYIIAFHIRCRARCTLKVGRWSYVAAVRGVYVLIRVYYTYVITPKFRLKVTHFFGVPELGRVLYTFMFFFPYAERQRVLNFSEPFIYSWIVCAVCSWYVLGLVIAGGSFEVFNDEAICGTLRRSGLCDSSHRRSSSSRECRATGFKRCIIRWRTQLGASHQERDGCSQLYRVGEIVQPIRNQTRSKWNIFATAAAQTRIRCYLERKKNMKQTEPGKEIMEE